MVDDKRRDGEEERNGNAINRAVWRGSLRSAFDILSRLLFNWSKAISSMLPFAMGEEGRRFFLYTEHPRNIQKRKFQKEQKSSSSCHLCSRLPKLWCTPTTGKFPHRFFLRLFPWIECVCLRVFLNREIMKGAMMASSRNRHSSPIFSRFSYRKTTQNLPGHPWRKPRTHLNQLGNK